MRHGFRRLRLRSYYAGAYRGAAFKVIEVDDPAGLLADLDRVGEGLGEPFPAVPRGRIRTIVAEMEDTVAHRFAAHSYIVTFPYGPYVVQIDAYATNATRGLRRVTTYAGEQYDLLRSKMD